MEQFDWSRFTVRIPINASKKDLYKAWATRQGIESWFLRSCEYKTATGEPRAATAFVETGDMYSWRWHGWPDSMVETGSILDCNGTDRFSFRFGQAGDCSITIKEEQGENIVELLQENIPSDEAGMRNYHLGCKTGWTFYFANLKSILEGGIDLRNKNEQIKKVISS